MAARARAGAGTGAAAGAGAGAGAGARARAAAGAGAGDAFAEDLKDVFGKHVGEGITTVRLGFTVRIVLF
jgi:hypothetical protein